MNVSYRKLALMAICGLLVAGCDKFVESQRNALLIGAGINPAAISKYDIQADLAGWKIVNHQNDPQGYYKMYESQNSTNAQERILINYGKNITTSLADSTQQIININQQLPCNQYTHQFRSLDATSGILKEQLNGCRQGPKSLIIYTKIFNASDGQYSIKYSSIPTHLPYTRLQEMQKIITNAGLK